MAPIAIAAGGGGDLATAAQPLFIALLGLLVVAAALLKWGLARVGVPALAGYLALGFLLRLGETTWSFLPEEGPTILRFLGRLGIIALLFRVGLESKVAQLREQLGRVGPIWAGSVIVSGLAGYAAARWLLGFALVPSLFAAVALTATSVGVALSVWAERGALRSDTGALLVDTVELDDLSGVVLMAVLFSLAPLLDGGGQAELTGSLLSTLAVVFVKAAVFLAGCYAFARYAEARITRGLKRAGGQVQRIVVVVGVGFVIAAVAEILGFSFAIGAFFAGLAFSGDPEAVKLDTSFEELHAFLVPFFFIWLGFELRLEGLGAAAAAGGVLAAAAILGKVVGTGTPAVRITGWFGALTLGVSVVPRAEIAMVIMERGLRLGSWAVPDRLFNAMIIVVLVTSTVFPVLTRRLLDSRRSQRAAG